MERRDWPNAERDLIGGGAGDRPQLSPGFFHHINGLKKKKKKIKCAVRAKANAGVCFQLGSCDHGSSRPLTSGMSFRRR